MSISIPQRFQKYLYPEVQTLLISDFINRWNGYDTYFSSTPYYFPEYTVHGKYHINKVLEKADKLIPTDPLTKEPALPKEHIEIAISALVLAIVLHDLGMFIKPEGLKFLIGESKQKSCNCEEWRSLWKKHITIMRHASGDQLKNVFIDEKPEFSMNSKPFCADFIRKHHHRLAYQIVIEGFPGVNLNDKIKNIENESFVKLAGIIAMSHGMSLRDQELQKMIEDFGYEDDLPLNVPAYYLMAVLRMADLLDASAERAPFPLFNSDYFASSYSQNEWELNQSIENSQWIIEKEKLHIVASPKNSQQYVKLKSWIDWWQNELDLSWAVIGEKYHKNYSLTIRRITSNLDNTDKYDFVTREMCIKVNPNITKLLIEPLYDNDPQYGVRELLQNAIDACNERKAIDNTEGHITVDVDTEKKLFVIKDNGIGMTGNIIADYFLTAGASFRESSEWRTDYLDNENNPKLARSGRFGIGAFAAFLIGSKVSVTTRSFKETMGYSFEYSIEPEILNVKKVPDAEIGTEIMINISDSCISKLGSNTDSIISTIQNLWFNQYLLKAPNITYTLNGNEVSPRNIFDMKKGVDSDGWISHDLPEFQSFHWSFSNQKSLYNGIVIDAAQAIDKDILKKHGYLSASFPQIAVMDNENNIEIDLSRKRIISPISIPDSLITEFCKYKIALALLHQATHAGTGRGFIPYDFAFLNNTNEEKIILCLRRKQDIRDTFEIYSDSKYVIFSQSVYTQIRDISSFKELYHREKELTNRFLPAAIDEDKEIQLNSMELPAKINKSDVMYYAKYDPLVAKTDNIMTELLHEYIPKGVNNGWIPFDMDKRQAMYPKAFLELKKYMEVIKRHEHEKWFIEE